MTFIKICGITNTDDALNAVAAGADALGFNFYPPSPRYISPHKAREIIEVLPRHVLTVGVFVNESTPQKLLELAAEANVKALQLHGDESPDYCRELHADYVIKVFSARTDFAMEQISAYQSNVAAIMLDAPHEKLRGGTGRVIDWSLARRVSDSVPRLFLAGGLSADNVGDAIRAVNPFAIDACSALEESPGKKNHSLVQKFIDAARRVKP